MELTVSQEHALSALLLAVDDGDRLVSLAGSAGTGKTTLIKELVTALQCRGRKVTVATPTNKAAQVLMSKGIPAGTFYKTFYLLERDVDAMELPSAVGFDGRALNFISVRNYLNNLPNQDDRYLVAEKLASQGKEEDADVLIIDEASMLTRRRITEMLAMCKTVILVGDHHQLPPVGDREFPEGYFTQLEHTAVLTEIMRQSEGSLILGLADELRRNGTHVNKMLRHFEPQESFAALVKQGFQAIAFTNKERQRINAVARRVLGFPSGLPATGDRILVTNNFDTDLINGTTVDVLDFSWNRSSYKGEILLLLNGRPVVRMMSMRAFAKDQVGSIRDDIESCLPPETDEEVADSLLELTYSYCMTAHKAQGSEWPGVIVFDQRQLIHRVQSGDHNPGLAPDEYVRRWTYTAITRARQTLFVAPTWFAKSY